MATIVPFSQASFALCGASGALIMFAADLVLYYPTTSDRYVKQHRTAASYFATIDPGGDNLADSTMQHIGINRVMCGGVLGPVSAVFYSIGFSGLAFGLQSPDQKGWGMPVVAAVGLSLMMTIGAAYHTLFAYTCFLSREIAKARKDHQQESALQSILSKHQNYMRYVYKWAATSGVIGSMAYIYCCLTSNTQYPRYSVFFVPVHSGPIKKMLKWQRCGGIILCGGLSNLWNLFFFLILYLNLV